MSLRRTDCGGYIFYGSVQLLRNIMDVIIDNYRIHGRAGSMVTGYRERDTPDGLLLELAFTNYKGPVVRSGGHGLSRLTELCRSHGLPEPRHSDGENVWTLFVALRPCGFVPWDPEGSNAILDN